jgi:hypothetical protein
MCQSKALSKYNPSILQNIFIRVKKTPNKIWQNTA